MNHEAGDETVEWCIIISAACAKGEKVLCGLRDCFAEELDFEVTVGGMELDRIGISAMQSNKVDKKTNPCIEYSL